MDIYKFLLTISILLIILLSSIFIGKFFDLSIGLFLGYILWFIGLAIFYFILPNEKTSIFLKS